MAISKIIFNGVVQMDVTGDTVAANNLLTGFTATGADGEQVIGQYQGGGGDSWSWMGKNPTLVKDYGTVKTYLKDTAFNTWTPTTTSTKIADAENLTAYVGDKSLYDYVIVHKMHTHFEYEAGATNTGKMQDYYANYVVDICGYAYNLANMTAGTINQMATGSSQIRSGMFFKNSSGVDTYLQTNGYGVYMYTTYNPSVTGSTSTITPKIPQINACCSNSYFSTTNAAAVDKNNSYYETDVKIYRVDTGTSNLGYQYANIRDMWLNGIS